MFKSKLPQKQRVLVVDDEPFVARTLADILQGSGYDVSCVHSTDAAMEFVSTQCPDVLISDVLMPGISGIDLAISVRDKCPNTRVLLISGHAGSIGLLDAVNKRGYDFELLSKPIRPEFLLQRLSS